MKRKITYREYKNNYNGALVLGLWLLLLSLSLYRTNFYSVLSTEVIEKIEVVLFFLSLTGVGSIIYKFMRKYNKGNYTDIELEGVVKDEMEKVH